MIDYAYVPIYDEFVHVAVLRDREKEKSIFIL